MNTRSIIVKRQRDERFVCTVGVVVGTSVGVSVGVVVGASVGVSVGAAVIGQQSILELKTQPSEDVPT
jgi:hypothetical protein